MRTKPNGAYSTRWSFFSSQNLTRWMTLWGSFVYPTIDIEWYRYRLRWLGISKFLLGNWESRTTPLHLPWYSAIIGVPACWWINIGPHPASAATPTKSTAPRAVALPMALIPRPQVLEALGLEDPGAQWIPWIQQTMEKPWKSHGFLFRSWFSKWCFTSTVVYRKVIGVCVCLCTYISQ